MALATSMEFADTLLVLLWYAFWILMIGLVVYTIVETRLRNQRLAGENPPTEQELAEVRRLRRPGVLHLGGRESAAARHFESSMRVNPISRDGGGQTVNSPHSQGVHRPWRDKRTER